MLSKRRTAALGRAAAWGDACRVTGERTCCLKGSGEGGCLARDRDFGGKPLRSSFLRCRPASLERPRSSASLRQVARPNLGVANLGGRFAVSGPAPIRDSLGGCVSQTVEAKAAAVPIVLDVMPARRNPRSRKRQEKMRGRSEFVPHFGNWLSFVIVAGRCKT